MTCASCKRERPAEDLLSFSSRTERRYVCRPTLKAVVGEPSPGDCFRRSVCWVGHHAIARA